MHSSLPIRPPLPPVPKNHEETLRVRHEVEKEGKGVYERNEDDERRLMEREREERPGPRLVFYLIYLAFLKHLLFHCHVLFKFAGTLITTLIDIIILSATRIVAATMTRVTPEGPTYTGLQIFIHPPMFANRLHIPMKLANPVRIDTTMKTSRTD
jgi:hypothetical protein